MDKKLQFVSDDDDWEGFYIDGELVAENHSLKWQDILELLDIKYERLLVDGDWLYDRGTLPEKFSEVKLNK